MLENNRIFDKNIYKIDIDSILYLIVRGILMFKNNSKILMFFGLFPFAIWLSLVSKGEVRIYTLIVGTLLLVGGYGISSSNKKWIISSIIALIICCSTFLMMGLRNDYFQFIECYIAVGMAIYYGILHFFNCRINK